MNLIARGQAVLHGLKIPLPSGRLAIVLILSTALLADCLCAGQNVRGATPRTSLEQLRPLPPDTIAPVRSDWLVVPAHRKAGVFRGSGTNELVLDNGLVRRTFRLHPNGATVGFDNLMTGASLIRAVKPEALITLDGTEYKIGGLIGQPDQAYLLPAWVERLQLDPASFQLVSWETGKPEAPFAWKRKRRAADLPWPPVGTTLAFRYSGATEQTRDLAVTVHYEINAPDYYFFSGSSKTGMGYREDNWSLPRAQQLIHGRQNIYDGTWEKTPTMGWMFVPLTEYHGGGAAATLEPLSEHLDAYEAHLANNFGAGVQACYRGPRLYDTDATQAVVKKWVSWFKQYRDILESDLIHLRRPDGRDLDCFLHVNPLLTRRALAVVYNPLNQETERTLSLPLYYAGLTDIALVREQTGKPRKFKLDRQSNIHVPVKVPANGRTWLVIEGR